MLDNTGRMISEALDIGLVANDLEAMMAFYEDGLGMLRIKDMELPGTRLIRFKAGRGILKFNQTSSTPDPAPGDVTGSRGMKLLTIVVPDLQVISGKLQAAGFPELTIADHGQYTLAFTKDPNGSLIELAGAEGFGPSPVLHSVGLTGLMPVAHLTEVLGFGQVEAIPSLGTDKYEFSAGATTLKLWQIDGLDAHTGPIQDYRYPLPDSSHR